MNINKVFILGNLTRDPQIRTTPTGQQVADFGIATNRTWTDKNGQKQQEAEFHNIVAWGRLAEICSQYLTKGKMVYIEGRLKTRSWDDQQTGVKKYKTEIIAETMQMGPKNINQGGNDFSAGATQQNQKPEEPIDIIEYPDDEGQVKLEDVPF